MNPNLFIKLMDNLSLTRALLVSSSIISMCSHSLTNWASLVPCSVDRLYVFKLNLVRIFSISIRPKHVFVTCLFKRICGHPRNYETRVGINNMCFLTQKVKIRARVCFCDTYKCMFLRLLAPSVKILTLSRCVLLILGDIETRVQSECSRK